MNGAATGERNIGVDQSVDGSALVSGDGNRIDQSRTVNIYYGLPDNQPNPNRKDRNEKTLLNAVWTEVDDRLRQSLHNAILIRLDMAEQRSQVSRPWDSELRTADQRPKTLAPGTPIAEVFDRRDVGGKLLVLGNPGAGKTTTMLDLAATLVQRANGDPDEPFPVMVNLSSWQNPNQSFTDWLLNELKLKYGMSAKLGQTWLTEKKLLPLLDGLDELPPARQEPVVQSINTWLQSETGVPRMLVCSRLEEYQLYASKLDLNGAICLSPLTNGQLKDYLASLKMAHLWETLQHDDDLLNLVRTPLLLSVSILANDDLEVTQWSRLQTTQERLDYLLDAYIGRRLHEPVDSKAYPSGKQPTARQTRHWLVWLAKQLQAESEDEFLIEKMQPVMLANRRQKLLYGLIFGLIFGLINGLKTDISNRVTPNQGIIKSARNILPISLLTLPGGILIALGGQFARSVADGSFSLNSPEIDISRAIAEGISYAFLIGGGLAGWQACAQHFSLRLMLYRTNAIPWNYARFLNHCTDRLLLQRVGGRYRFIHRLVQERFAAMPLDR